jgi:hypothetical protein
LHHCVGVERGMVRVRSEDEIGNTWRFYLLIPRRRHSMPITGRLHHWRAVGCEYICIFGPSLMGRSEARFKHGMIQNILVSGRYGPIYRVGFRPRSRPMAGTSMIRLRQTRNNLYSGTKRPISILYLHQFQRSSRVIFYK